MTQEEREELFAALHERMEAERETYREKLLHQTPAQILENADRYVMYGELMNAIDRCVEEDELDDAEVRALADLDYPLDAAYWIFVDTDCDLSDSLRDCFLELVEQEAEE